MERDTSLLLDALSNKNFEQVQRLMSDGDYTRDQIDLIYDALITKEHIDSVLYLCQHNFPFYLDNWKQLPCNKDAVMLLHWLHVRGYQVHRFQLAAIYTGDVTLIRNIDIHKNNMNDLIRAAIDSKSSTMFSHVLALLGTCRRGCITSKEIATIMEQLNPEMLQLAIGGCNNFKPLENILCSALNAYQVKPEALVDEMVRPLLRWTMSPLELKLQVSGDKVAMDMIQKLEPDQRLSLKQLTEKFGSANVVQHLWQQIAKARATGKRLANAEFK